MESIRDGLDPWLCLIVGGGGGGEFVPFTWKRGMVMWHEARRMAPQIVAVIYQRSDQNACALLLRVSVVVNIIDHFCSRRTKPRREKKCGPYDTTLGSVYTDVCLG